MENDEIITLTTDERDEYIYNAFISYKHATLDQKIAKKIQKKLEHFYISKELQKKTGIQKIKKVFRDQEELSAGIDLVTEIEEQLSKSEFLILICSKESKKSIWVNRELETFLRYHEIDKVIPILVDGEPKEVCPDLLLNKVELLAVDIRETTELKILRKVNKEFYRLVAPILHCDYDDLVQRQKRYAMKMRVFAASVLITLSSAFSIYASIQNKKINKAYIETLKSNSAALNEYAQKSIEDANYLSAIEQLLQAIPQDKSIPVNPKTHRLLTEALDTYKIRTTRVENDNKYSMITTQVQNNAWKDFNTIHSELDFLIDPDGKYLFTIEEGILNIWDSYSLRPVRRIKCNGVTHLNKIQSSHFMGNDCIFLYDSQYAMMYNYVTGEKKWSKKIDEKISRVLITEEKKIFILASSNIIELSNKNGMILNVSPIDYNGLYLHDENHIACLSNDENLIIFSSKKTDGQQKIEGLFQYNLKSRVIKELTHTNIIVENKIYDGNNYADEKEMYSDVILEDNHLVYVKLKSLVNKDSISNLTTFSISNSVTLYKYGPSIYDYEIVCYDTNRNEEIWKKTLRADEYGKHLLRYNQQEGCVYYFSGEELFGYNINSGKEVTHINFEGYLVKDLNKENMSFISSEGFLFTHDDHYNWFNLQKLDPLLQMQINPNVTNSIYAISKEGVIKKWEEKSSILFDEAIEIPKIENCDYYLKEIYSYDEWMVYLVGGSDSYSDSYYAYKNKKGEIFKTGIVEKSQYIGMKNDNLIFYQGSKNSYVTVNMNTEMIETIPVFEKTYISNPNVFTDSLICGDGNDLYLFNLENKVEKSYTFDWPITTMKCNEKGTMALMLDSTNSKFHIINLENGNEISSFSAEFIRNGSVVNITSSIKWLGKDKYLSITDQNHIYIYDLKGKLHLVIPYDNRNTTDSFTAPFIFLSDDCQDLFFITDGVLYRYSFNNGKYLNKVDLDLYGTFSSDYNINLISYEFVNHQLYLLNENVCYVIDVDKEAFDIITVVPNCLGYDSTKQEFWLFDQESKITKIGFIKEKTIDDLVDKALETPGLYSNTDFVDEVIQGQTNIVQNNREENNSIFDVSTVQDMYTFVLVPSVEEEKSIEKKNLDILKGRLSVLAKDHKILFKEEKNRIIVSVPKECFGKNEPMDIMELYVTDTMLWSIYSVKNMEMNNYGNITPIPWDYLTKLELKDIVSVKCVEPTNLDDGKITITLTDSFTKKLDSLNLNKNDYLAIKQLAESETKKWWYHHIIKQAAKNKWSLSLKKDSDLYEYKELFMYNFEHQTLSCPYNCYLADDLSWETQDSYDTIYGDNQIEINKLENMNSELWYFEINTNEKSGWNNSDWQDYLTKLKYILDGLGSKYSCAKVGKNNYALLIEKKKLTKNLIENIISNESLSIWSKDSSLKTGYLVVDSDQSIHNYFTSVVLSQLESKNFEDGDKVYLGFNNYPIASATYKKDLMKDGLIFDTIYLNTTNHDFIERLCSVQGISKESFIKVKSQERSRYGKLIETTQDDFPSIDWDLFTQQVKNICSTATIDYGNYYINISLHLEDSDDMIQKGFSMIHDICYLVDNNKEFLIKINSIKLADTEVNERCDISFNNKSIQLHGGKYDVYQDEVKLILEQDSFWKEYKLN